MVGNLVKTSYFFLFYKEKINKYLTKINNKIIVIPSFIKFANKNPLESFPSKHRSNRSFHLLNPSEPFVSLFDLVKLKLKRLIKNKIEK